MVYPGEEKHLTILETRMPFIKCPLQTRTTTGHITQDAQVRQVKTHQLPQLRTCVPQVHLMFLLTRRLTDLSMSAVEDRDESHPSQAFL